MTLQMKVSSVVIERGAAADVHLRRLFDAVAEKFAALPRPIAGDHRREAERLEAGGVALAALIREQGATYCAMRGVATFGLGGIRVTGEWHPVALMQHWLQAAQPRLGNSGAAEGGVK